MKCLDDEAIFALADGAASEKDEGVWRKHITGCARCGAELRGLQKALEVLAEDEPLDVESHTNGVMARLDGAPARRRPFAPLALSAIALAAALVVGIGIGRGTRPSVTEDFTPRGGGSATGSTIAREVALDLFVGAEGGRFERVAPNAEIASDAALLASGRNLATADVFALVFLVDAKNVVHWIYPAWTDPKTDPRAVSIPMSTDLTSLGDAVAFSDLALGPAEIVAVLGPLPMSVSQIEQRHDLAPDSLKRAFPAAEVRSIAVRVRAP